jgi:hypothetical protein
MIQPMAEIIIEALRTTTKRLSQTETGYNKNIEI